MFRGGEWFAWYPVIVNDNGYPRLAWLETVWRDRSFKIDGSVATTRYFTR